MKWPDGHPFTAYDVMFFYEDRLFDENARASDRPTPPSNFLADGKPIRLEKIDDNAIRFTSPKPMGRLQDWAMMAATTPLWHREASRHLETEWLIEATRHIKAAMTTVDTVEIRRHMESVRDLHTENVPIIVVGSPYHLWGASTRLGNVPKDGTTADVFRGWSRPVFHEQLYFKREP